MNFGGHRPSVQLGAGRDGVRFRAEAPRLGEPSELRTLAACRADPPRWRSIAHRLRAVALLDHPACRRILAVDLEADPPWVVVEWADGPTLADRLADGAIGRGEAVAILIQLARGIEAAHRLGLAHGAIGPGRIVLSEGRTPRLDWTGLDVGAWPDEGAIAPDRPSRDEDLFGLGRTMARLLDDDAEVGDPTLADLHARLLAAEPLDRPGAGEVASALEDWLGRSGLESDVPSDSLAVAMTGLIEFPPARAPWESARPEPRRERIGRFRLVEQIGQGGMGTVHLAIDPIDDREVAIKLLNPAWSERPLALRRFLKEARVLAEVSSRHVVDFLEINEDDGVHYLVLEYVRGENLGQRVARLGRLDEPTALAIMADVARGLASAHERGIVHRDVKPENVMLVEDDERDRSGTRVKVSDFGIARHMIETESLAMTVDGSILGTPGYMAPEQSSGGTVDTRADVYAMGATLFHLLAGRPPFVGPTPFAVIGMQQSEPPTPLKTLNPGVSEATAEVVARCLAKSPSSRYRDASAFLADVERLLRGEPTGIEVHPKLPEHDPSKVIAYDWRFELESSPERLWPHVANTERLNKAIGIPPGTFVSEPDPGGGVRRFGRARKSGMDIEWREHEFEWVEGRRLGVLREYSIGPIHWMVSNVELAPASGGGTTLHHRVRVMPKGLLGRTATAVEVGIRGRRSVEAVYRRIDDSVLGKLGRGGSADPFEPPSRLEGDRRRRIDRWLDSLSGRGFDPGLVERLGDFLAFAPSQEVARIRPIALARRIGVDAEELIRACLLGAREGTLVLLWDILCPACRVPARIISSLRELGEQADCESCRIDFRVDFANSVEMIFRAHPEIRDSDLSVYCVAGPLHSPHVAAQVRLGPGERFVLALALPEGAYRIRGPQLPHAIDFRVDPEATDDRWAPPIGRGVPPESVPTLRPGGQALELNNPFDREVVVRVERTARRTDAITAGRASTMAVFRDLFPGEVLEAGRLVSLATATFLVARLGEADRLYEEQGDARVFGLLHDLFRRIEREVRIEGGTLVKTAGEGASAAFDDPVAATRAALALAGADPSAGDDARLRVAVHSGPALVATINDRIDYFGQTVRLAEALPRLGRDGEVILTDAVASEPGVARLLRDRGMDALVVEDDATGFPGGFVFRVAPRAAAESGPIVPRPGLLPG